ncbi:MAG: ClbS/DfsB family four-helix bundle protein [Anaerolineales bacterium]|nr:ClbS/DfsB family four-helix bundle protein [Anaerolineales bacterium]
MKKSELLQWLQEEYRQWKAFLDQIGPERMDQPGVAGHWSIKDIVAHMTDWQPMLITRLQAAQRGEPEPPPPWPVHLQTDDEINEWIYEANHGRSVRDVLDESHRVFQQFLAVIEDLPDDILIESTNHVIQFGSQRFSASEFFDHFHDDHEPDIRAWLARTENE